METLRNSMLEKAIRSLDLDDKNIGIQALKAKDEKIHIWRTRN